MKFIALATKDFQGTNSKDAKSRIPIEKYQVDENGNRSRRMTWRPRRGLARNTNWGRKSNPVVSLQLYRLKNGTLAATLVDGSRWQGYAPLLTGPLWEDAITGWFVAGGGFGGAALGG